MGRTRWMVHGVNGEPIAVFPTEAEAQAFADDANAKKGDALNYETELHICEL